MKRFCLAEDTKHFIFFSSYMNMTTQRLISLFPALKVCIFVLGNSTTKSLVRLSALFRVEQ